MYNGVKMKSLIIKADKKSIKKAYDLLNKSLKKGDIILTGPIPNNFFFKYFNFISMISRKVLRGITHSCLYLGNGYVFDIDHKIIRNGDDMEKITLKKLIQNKINHFGGVIIYVVQPKLYTLKNRNLVVKETVNNFLKKSKFIAFSYFESLKAGFRFFFERHKFYKKENLNFQKKWNCSHIVAHILKKSGTPIGKRVSYTFVPCTFVFSRHFKVKQKVILK